MVMLYTCEACKRGEHKKCEKGNPAPPGYFGGSLCNCHHMDHSGGYKGLWKRTEKFLKQMDDYRKKSETSEIQKIVNSHTY